jgi:hypothetical protein
MGREPGATRRSALRAVDFDVLAAGNIRTVEAEHAITPLDLIHGIFWNHGVRQKQKRKSIGLISLRVKS